MSVSLVHMNAGSQETQEPFAVVLAHRIAEPVALLDSAVLSSTEYAHAVLCLNTLLTCAKPTSFKQSASQALMRVCLHRMSVLLQQTLAQLTILTATDADEIPSRSDTLAEQDCLVHPWNTQFLSTSATDFQTIESLLTLSHNGWPTPVLALLGKIGCLLHMAELLERALTVQMTFQQTDCAKVPAQIDEKVSRFHPYPTACSRPSELFCVCFRVSKSGSRPWTKTKSQCGLLRLLWQLSERVSTQFRCSV